MSWDGTPWFVGGGAQHSPEVARVLAYVAFRGNEGIVAAGDCAVKALGVPGGSVTVDPGAVAVLCRATGQLNQAYAGRMATQDTVNISATGSGSGRSDLIVARVEDPWLAGEPWSDPVDPAEGPYIFTRVIPNVPNTTKTVAQLGLGYSAIALARIDIPVSTGTITQGMITDLRQIANPRRERKVEVSRAAPTTLINTSGFKDLVSASVAVPPWATYAKLVVSVSGLALLTGNTIGNLRATLNSVVTPNTLFDENWLASGTFQRSTYMVATEAAIPANLRGTTQTLKLQGARTSGPGTLQVDSGSTIVFDIEWYEVPE